jgi:anaerobic magnesium-protoporphyrin IX monomethyl ester cyclase
VLAGNEKQEGTVADILLTHSYHLYYDSKQVRKMQPYPPLGTLYAAALLRDSGHSVAVFDTMLTNPEQGFREALARYRPKIVVVYEDNFNFLSKMCLSRMREVAYDIAEASRRAGAIALVNGSDASDHRAEYLKAGFVCVLLGEAEWSLLETVRQLGQSSKLALSQVPGIAYADSAGQVGETPRRGLTRDLDRFPLPARDLVEMGSYRQLWRRAHGFFSMNMISSRGCPYRCNWCAKPIYGNSFALRSAGHVADEMRILKHHYEAEHIWFADDIFGLKANWIQDLALEVEKRDAAVPFKMQSRVDLMSAQTAKALRRAGCAEVWMGVESGSQKVLNAMDKGTRVEQIARAREHLRGEGIRACYFIQFGYPGENWEDIRLTVDLVRATRPDDVGVSVSYPLPGTKFYQRVREQLGAKTNWKDSGDISMMFRGAYSDEFYRALHDYLHAEVDSWNSSPHPNSSATGHADSAQRWQHILKLESSCRNADPTALGERADECLVQLRAADTDRVRAL